MEKLVKPIDKTDVYNFLSDNYTSCTKEYYNLKFNGMIDDEFAILLECLSRNEHDVFDIEKAKENIILKHARFAEKLEEEFEKAKMETYDIENDKQQCTDTTDIISNNTSTTSIFEFNECEYLYERNNEK
jgi:hypothetical protein